MKIMLLVSIGLTAMFIAGCGGALLIDSPKILWVAMDSTSVRVDWEIESTIENHEDFQGYNVYVAYDSTELLVVHGEDLNKINADVITGHTFTATDLDQDSIHYIQVRTVNTENRVGYYNDSIPFVRASPRPEFTVTLVFELNQSGVDDSCAIRFSDAMIMSDSAMANGGADMWVFNDSAITFSFDSPNTHSQYGGNARITYFDNLGNYELDSIFEVTTEPSESSVGIFEGDLVVAKTEDGNYVKIHVETIDTLNYTITITYAYQNVVDFPHF